MSRNWFWAESSSSTKSCSSRACFFALFWDSSRESCRQHQSIVSTGSRAKAMHRARWYLQVAQDGRIAWWLRRHGNSPPHTRRSPRAPAPSFARGGLVWGYFGLVGKGETFLLYASTWQYARTHTIHLMTHARRCSEPKLLCAWGPARFLQRERAEREPHCDRPQSPRPRRPPRRGSRGAQALPNCAAQRSKLAVSSSCLSAHGCLGAASLSWLT